VFQILTFFQSTILILLFNDGIMVETVDVRHDSMKCLRRSLEIHHFTLIWDHLLIQAILLLYSGYQELVLAHLQGSICFL